MKEYILENKIIITTPERYEKTFKLLGYKPYEKEENIKEETEKIQKNKWNRKEGTYGF